MKIIELGHIEIANLLDTKTFWLGWGTASTQMSSVPETSDTTSLENEVGRTIEIAHEFVTPDASGTITVGGQNWLIESNPTKYLYLKFTFDSTQNNDVTIRQLGIFIDCTLATGHESDTYVNMSSNPEYFSDQGKLFEYMNQADLNRNDVSTETYEFILTF